MNSVEGLRQALGAVFYAVADASGNEAYRKAVASLQESLKARAVDDAFARCILEGLIRHAAVDVGRAAIPQDFMA